MRHRLFGDAPLSVLLRMRWQRCLALQSPVGVVGLSRGGPGDIDGAQWWVAVPVFDFG